MKLSEMKRMLDERGIQLTKSLGQNFLHDANQLNRIVESAELRADDRVLEVGPGLGPLTRALLERSARVLAIEKDQRLAQVLSKELEEPLKSGRLELIHGDGLGFIERGERDWTDWKVVSNLPYSIASPLLVELACGQTRPERIVATLQAEVVRRLIASPAHGKDYGILTLLLQLDYAPRDSFKIPASCFFPEPEVESACITLIRRPAPLLPASTRKVFSRIVKRSFSQRRKMVLKLLKADWPADALQETFAELGISAQARAENVSLEQFVQLSARMAAAAGSAEEIFDVVNENDEVIGSAPRGEVHRTGAMHRATHVLAFNQRGEVFLQKRSMLKDRQPGKWDSSASGHVDSGESYDACAVRELREELGWTADAPLEKLFKLTAGAETDQEHVWVYRCAAEGPFQLLASEIERGDWFEPRAVTEWMNRSPEDFAPAFRLVWKRLTTVAPPAGNPKHETRNPK